MGEPHPKHNGKKAPSSEILVQADSGGSSLQVILDSPRFCDCKAEANPGALRRDWKHFYPLQPPLYLRSVWKENATTSDDDGHDENTGGSSNLICYAGSIVTDSIALLAAFGIVSVLFLARIALIVIAFT
ncbi:unnamed protein product [Nippostrongylus brasiliensis]|uniref:Transmembrane protein n=1 Tax=Nippostrongylus brasiliensis TaxID=27835 RepID=A0A0N4YAG0_NIPBR|nr:unnamed protein product [Nippostrongylus brasiliensis]